MSGGEREPGGRSPADAAGRETVPAAASDSSDREPERASGAFGDGPPPRGFRSQPVALRLLLFASLAAIAVGVVRCSIELSGVRPPIQRVGVARALVDIDEDGALAPGDSVAVRASRLFAASLGGVSEADVILLPAGEPGVDVIARLRVSSTEGRIRVAVGVKDGSSGRALFETGGEGTPEMLEALLSTAALRVAGELGIAKRGGGKGEGKDADRETRSG